MNTLHIFTFKEGKSINLTFNVHETADDIIQGSNTEIRGHIKDMAGLKILPDHHRPLECLPVKRLDVETEIGISEARYTSRGWASGLRYDTEGILLVLCVNYNQRVSLVLVLDLLPGHDPGDGVKVGDLVKVAVEVGRGGLQLGEPLTAGHVGAVPQLSPESVEDAGVQAKTSKVNVFVHLIWMRVLHVVRGLALGTLAS